MNKQIESLKCEKCTGVQSKDNFYKPLEKHNICKDCFYEEFIYQYTGIFNQNYGDTMNWICEKYDIPFIFSLIYYHKDIINIKEKLESYMNDVSSLPIYQSNNKEEKSDLDFINDDIKQLKKNIEKAIQKEDFNAHNKWMNCLRDAIELRETLKGGSKYTINLGTVNVNSNSAEDLINELTKIVSKQVNCK